MSKTDFRTAVAADSKRSGDSSDSDSDGAQVRGPKLHRTPATPATSASEFGQFPQTKMDLDDTRAVWVERLAEGHGAGVLRAIGKSFSQVKPYPGNESARATYKAQLADAWLSLSRFVADACVSTKGRAAPSTSAQDVRKHLTLSVRASMLAALAQAIAHHGARAESYKEDCERFARLAASVSDPELMPAELDSRIETFRLEFEAAMGEVDWAKANQASRLQALGFAVQAVSVGENLGLDIFTPVRVAREPLAVSARYDGKARAIAVGTDTGWDDRGAVVSAVVRELGLRHAASLADQLSRGQAPRSDPLQQLAKVMLASEKVALVATSQAQGEGPSAGDVPAGVALPDLAQRHAQVFSARVMAKEL